MVDQGLGSGIKYWKQPACKVGRGGGGVQSLDKY